MKTNVGSLDHLIRLLLASVLFYLGLFLYIEINNGTQPCQLEPDYKV
jgi:hypothetical protein